MRRLSSKRISYVTETTANPMDGLGNLADAMLVLAVGIMLALILNWKVDITAVGASAEPVQDAPQQIAIDENDLSAPEEQPDEDEMKRVGELYYDEDSGTYYAVVGD